MRRFAGILTIRGPVSMANAMGWYGDIRMTLFGRGRIGKGVAFLHLKGLVSPLGTFRTLDVPKWAL